MAGISHKLEKNADFSNNASLIYDPLAIGLDTDRVSIIIDGNDIHALSRAISQENVLPGFQKFTVDYKRLSEVLTANFPNIKRKYFITSEIFVQSKEDIELGRAGHSKIRGTLDWLRYNRYIVRSIPVEIGADSHYTKINENIMDVEITTALFEAAKVSDHIIFVGSHRKFYTPLQRLFEEGKTITVMSSIRTNSVSVHDMLRQIDNFVDLAEPVLAEMIGSRKLNLPIAREVKEVAAG